KIKAAGFIPVAWGGQPWQEATVFEIVVAGIGGTVFYKKALVDADPAAINSPTMVKALETLEMIKKYTDPGAPGRDWNLATAMVIKGEAAMQFMGDWAKGEFTAAGKKPNVDYVAAAAPQTEGQFIFNIDSFIFFKVAAKNETAQKAMARLILQPKFQEVFNLNKGSIPVRLGMSEEPFDAPARKSMKDFVAADKSGNLIPSMAHEMAVMPAIRGAFMDTIADFYNSEMSVGEAAGQMANAVQAAK
ncbi:MAG TPA: carbohydrate ABC transporter substrate-binding protein, partial [Spirochaetia bacterium]|nr:carbohydrate ABC transporter substrate-binding protein [Spirochaetia bacterium]